MKTLKTLSAIVSEYQQTYKEYFESEKIVESLKVKAKDCLMSELGLKVFKAKKQLDLPVTLSIFIPFENGKPLKKPERYDNWVSLGMPNIDSDRHKEKKAYKNACEAVLFEGWELVSNTVFNIGVRAIDIKNKDWQLQFYYGGTYEGTVALMQDVSRPLPDGTKPLLHDLAEATIENPIKLKQ